MEWYRNKEFDRFIHIQYCNRLCQEKIAEDEWGEYDTFRSVICKQNKIQSKIEEQSRIAHKIARNITNSMTNKV